mgnify:CR=1 FL=1|tara:strand:- start:5061 stop:8534 length:3474 start_codon:yes stop_codon:yes gene_type:complete
MVKRYSDAPRVKIQSGNIVNANLGRIDSRPINTMLQATKNLANTIGDIYTKKGIDQAKEQGAEDGKNVTIEYENGVPILPSFEIEGGPAYRNAYKSASENVYLNTLQQDIRKKISESRNSFESSDQRNQPEIFARNLKALKESIVPNVSSNFANIANFTFDQFATTNLNDIRKRTATLNYNTNVKGTQTALSQAIEDIQDQNLTLDDYNESNPIHQNVVKNIETLLQLNPNMKYYTDQILTDIDSNLKANKIIQDIFSRDPVSKKQNVSNKDIGKLASILLGEDNEVTIGNKIFNKEELIEAIPSKAVRINLAGRLSRVLNIKNAGDETVINLKNAIAEKENEYFRNTRKLPLADKLIHAETLMKEIQTLQAQYDPEKNDYSIATNNAVTNYLLRAENTVQNIIQTIETKRTNDVINQIEQSQIAETFSASANIENPANTKALAKKLTDNGNPLYSELAVADEQIVIDFASLIADLGKTADNGSLLIQDETLNKVLAMVDGSIQGTVTINDIEYTHQDIQKITKPFIPNNILKQHVDNLKRIASSSGAGGTQLAANVNLLNEYIFDQSPENRANIFNMEDGQYDRVLNYYITGDDKEPFLGKILSEGEESIEARGKLFAIIKSTNRVPKQIINYLNQTHLSGTAEDFINAQNLFNIFGNTETEDNTRILNILEDELDSNYYLYKAIQDRPRMGNEEAKEMMKRIAEVKTNPENNIDTAFYQRMGQLFDVTGDAINDKTRNINQISQKLMNRVNSVFSSPKEENIINNFGHSFVEGYIGDRLVDFILDGDLGNLTTANRVKNDFIEYAKKRIENMVSFKDGSTYIIGVNKGHRDPANILKANIYDPERDLTKPFKNSVYNQINNLANTIQDKTDNVYQPNNMLANIQIVNIFKNYGAIELADNGLPVETDPLVEDLNIELNSVPDYMLGLHKKTKAIDMLSLEGKRPLLLGVNAFLLPQDDGTYALVYRENESNAVNIPLINEQGEAVRVPASVLFDSNNLIRTRVDNLKKANMYKINKKFDSNALIKNFGNPTERMKISGREIAKYYNSFDSLESFNNIEGSLINLNRYYLSSTMAEEVNDPIKYSVRKHNNNFYVVPNSMPVISNGTFAKQEIRPNKYNFNMYPKYTSESEATTRLGVIQEQVNKDYQTHKRYTGN